MDHFTRGTTYFRLPAPAFVACKLRRTPGAILSWCIHSAAVLYKCLLYAEKRAGDIADLFPDSDGIWRYPPPRR